MTNARMTDAARGSLRRAREEAVALGHDYVGTEHILLGLMRDRSVSASVQRLGTTIPDIRYRIELAIRRGRATPSRDAELPFTSRSLKVLEFTKTEALHAGHDAIRSDDLLLGLLREEKGIACEILNQVGITLERVRADVATP